MDQQLPNGGRLSQIDKTLADGVESEKLEAVAAVQAQGRARGLGPRALLGLLNVCGFDAGRALRLLENPYVRIRGLDEVKPVAQEAGDDSPVGAKVEPPPEPPPKLNVPEVEEQKPRHRGPTEAWKLKTVSNSLDPHRNSEAYEGGGWKPPVLPSLSRVTTRKNNSYDGARKYLKTPPSVLGRYSNAIKNEKSTGRDNKIEPPTVPPYCSTKKKVRRRVQTTSVAESVLRTSLK